MEFSDFFDRLYSQGGSEFDSEFPFYPIDAPGMPLPGPDFVAHARALGDQEPTYLGKSAGKCMASCGRVLKYLYRRALYDPYFAIPVSVKGVMVDASFVPGHMLAPLEPKPPGPQQAKIMVITKNPTRDEVVAGRYGCGDSSLLFLDMLYEAGFTDEELADVYMTALVKFPALTDRTDTLSAAYKQDCAILLEQEIRLVRPDYMLCLGTDAGKHLLDSAGSVSAMVGRVMERTYELGSAEEPSPHTVKIMVAAHPGAVLRTPESQPECQAQLNMFASLTRGVSVGGVETDTHHRNVYKLDELRRIIDKIRASDDPWSRVIAVDGEWQGNYPTDEGAYLRTIQFSAAEKEAYCVVLQHQNGSDAFKPSPAAAIEELKRLLKTDVEAGWYPRIGGHFLRADLPWLIHAGLDLRDEYEASPTLETVRFEGGWDTSHMYHAVNETASFRLTDVMCRVTRAPVYDHLVAKERASYCQRNKLKADDIDGYGFLPAWILHPEPEDPEGCYSYASYDADSTRRIAMRHLLPGGLLDSDAFGNPSWEAYWLTHSASLGVLEMEMTGLVVDRERVDALTVKYATLRERLLTSFRQKINWPNFNPDSNRHCIALLFGDSYVAKIDKVTGQSVGVLPPGVQSFGLTPIKTTGKRSRQWAEVERRRLTASYSPSSDKETLGILGNSHPLTMQLRDIKFISQILKGALRRPQVDSATSEWATDEADNYIYEKGIASLVDSVGVVRTHISQNKETGRYSSARPPLQNISEKREGDYSRIAGKMARDKVTGEYALKGDYTADLGEPYYLYPVRTIFKSHPGTVLVGADYSGAELAGIAWLANDPTMIEHVRRNGLPDDHPDKLDIHSTMAVTAFKLSCPPTKKGLEDLNLSPLRVAAKAIIFGIPYGRKADALVRQCREEGALVTLDECSKMIDFYFEQYPGVATFLENCISRTQNERWMVGPFGRRRRFGRTGDESVIAEQGRQGCNFPVQNCVADACTMAIANFTRFKKRNPTAGFRQALQIHDELLFSVDIPYLRTFCKSEVADDGTIIRPSVLHQCMIQQVPVWPRYLDGTKMPVQEPYFFSSSIDIQVNWGEKITEQQAISLGIDLDLL